MRPIAENIPAASILFMLLTAIISIVPKNGKTVCRMTAASLLLLFMASTSLSVYLYGGKYFTYSMGEWGAPWGNELRAGPAEALMAAVFSFVTLMSVIGGRSDAAHDIAAEKQGFYYIMLDLLTASLLALIYTNDLFTGYVFIEINTVAACALVMAKEDGASIVAAVRYLLMSLAGSALFLMSLVLLYGITGHLLMESLAPAVAEIAESGKYLLPLAALTCMMVCGLAIKSALYPFSTWLPDAHGSSTATSSVMLSGVVIKGYIIFMIKIFVRCLSLELANRLGVTEILFAFGAAAMVMGSLKAMKETHFKRMIAYSSVAQAGYIFIAFGMGTEDGVTAAFFQIIAHAVTKSLIIISAAGLIDASGHSKQLGDLAGAARRCPTAGIGFTVGGLAMVGMPLLGSFSMKLLIAGGAIGQSWRMIAVLVVIAVSSVLNALYYLPAIIRLWTAERSGEDKAGKPELSMTAAISLLSAAVVGLGVFYEPVAALIRRGVGLL